MKDDHDGDYKDQYDCNGNEFHNLDDDIHNDDEHKHPDDECIMIMLCLILIFVGLSLRYSNISVYSVSAGGGCDRL